MQDFIYRDRTRLSVYSLAMYGLALQVRDADATARALIELIHESKRSRSTRTVGELLDETQGRVGVLPLLQFVLSRIWLRIPLKAATHST